ncbi:MAG: cation:dicarboxylase symporter family transporter [Pseudomonadales bacterium]|nr:cation:dicarboxylase symporter family transporter [Pseudomonadales bacterium]
MSILTIINLLVFAGLIVFLIKLRSRQLTLSRQVLSGLVIGLVFGGLLQLVYSSNAVVLNGTLEWTNVVANIYVGLLRMIIMPLVLVTMVAAVLRITELASIGRIGGSVIGLLVLTTMIAAMVGIAFTLLFGLNAEGIVGGAREMARAEVLEVRRGVVSDLSLAEVIVSFIPSNIFSDLAGSRDTSIIAVVIFGVLLGTAALLVSREQPEQEARIKGFVDASQAVVMKLVRIVLALTPYGVMALMVRVLASATLSDILSLIGFIVASYLAIVTMFLVHGLMLTLVGVNAKDYFRKVWPVLTFAFATRSSAATIPLNIKTQIEELKVPESIASLSASFGATIGQNGCAGIYPAMLAVMVAPTMGINPLDPGFLILLISVITISSFGVAGVGGGATFAALIVLPAVGLPVTLVALLISIEPLIDMARTALNVNGAMTSGVITGRWLKEVS